MVPPSNLADRSLAELHELAAERGVPRFRALRREDLIQALGGEAEAAPAVDELEDLEDAEEDERAEVEPEESEPEESEPEGEAATGVLEIVPDGFGFLRVEGFRRSPDDVFVTRSQIRALGLRSGDELSGPMRRRRRSERHASLAEVQTVNGRPADDGSERPDFENLTPVQPSERLALDGDLEMANRVAPLLKGGRTLIEGPPRAGATRLLRRIVEATLRQGSLVPVVLVLDARPEELTDWQREAKYAVHGLAADASADAQVELATIGLERARRLVEQGDDVLLAVDSISRLARAHGQARSRQRDEQSTGVQFAKRWFAAGRNTEEGGSLTILATAHSDGPLQETLVDVATAVLALDVELGSGGHEPPIDVRRSFARAEGLPAGEAEELRRLHGALQSLPAREAWQHVADSVR